MAAPKISLDSLAKVVLGNRITFGYLLAEQGGGALHHLLHFDISGEVET